MSSDTKELATVLHDLRQPLQSISLLNAALLRHVDGEAALQMLRAQGESIANMRSLLNSVLDISEREGGSADLSGG